VQKSPPELSAFVPKEVPNTIQLLTFLC